MLTADLTGVLLDCWVAKALDPAEKVYLYADGYGIRWHRAPPAYSTQWALGGPIMDRERIGVHMHDMGRGCWVAFQFRGTEIGNDWSGPTALIAAMRAFVASKFGETLTPDEMRA